MPVGLPKHALRVTRRKTDRQGRPRIAILDPGMGHKGHARRAFQHVVGRSPQPRVIDANSLDTTVGSELGNHNLAIVECIVAIAAYVGIGVYLGTFKHLTWVVVVAPLMLFRTDVSAEWALKVYEQFGDWSLYRVISIHTSYVFTEKSGYLICRLIVFVLSLVLYSTISAMAGVTLRCSGTLYWLLRKPLYTLREAPQNWLRQSLCTDFFHPPEIIPLEFVKRRQLKGMYLSNAIADVLSQRSFG